MDVTGVLFLGGGEDGLAGPRGWGFVSDGDVAVDGGVDCFDGGVVVGGGGWRRELSQHMVLL